MFHFFKKFLKGFTVIELLVSVGLISSILSIVTSNQNDFTKTARINNSAEELATNIRLVQSLGSTAEEGEFDGTDTDGVRWSDNYDVQEVSSAYALYIPVTSETEESGGYVRYKDNKLLGYAPTGFDGSNGIFFYYVTPYNGFSECPSISGYQECLEHINLPKGYKISDICLVRPYFSECGGISDVRVYFFRPSLRANITYTPVGSSAVIPIRTRGVSEIEIHITSPEGVTKKVSVNLAGLVEVK